MKHNFQRRQNNNNTLMSVKDTPLPACRPDLVPDESINRILIGQPVGDPSASNYDMSDAILQRNMDQSILCHPPHFNSSSLFQFQRDLHSDQVTQQV
jgi:hypothetical protein